jgi:hypothetical protein
MRIAQIAPLYEAVPPALYGGTERIVSYLSGALVDLGHDVTFFSSGESQTNARLVPGMQCGSRQHRERVCAQGSMSLSLACDSCLSP